MLCYTPNMKTLMQYGFKQEAIIKKSFLKYILAYVTKICNRLKRFEYVLKKVL